jgi:hypothetical protein
MRKLVLKILTLMAVTSTLDFNLVFLSGCSGGDGRECVNITADPSKLINLNSVYKGFVDVPPFQNSPIHIPAYAYDDTIHVNVRGDTVIHELIDVTKRSPCELQQIIDLTTNEPSLSWTNTKDKLVAAAIFKSRIRLDARSTIIQNDEAAVWGWHTGLKTGGVETGDKYVVDFHDGRMVRNGIIQESEMASPLKHDSVYYWLVWAWDENGTKIIRSSREIPIIVTKDAALPSILVSYASELMGTWTLASAIDVTTNEDVTDKFYIRKMEIRNNGCKAPVKFTDPSGTLRTDTLYSIGGWSFELENDQEFSISKPRINCDGLLVTLGNKESSYQVFFKK